jgi:hypothetical protein
MEQSIYNIPIKKRKTLKKRVSLKVDSPRLNEKFIDFRSRSKYNIKKDIIMQIGNAVACRFAFHLGNHIKNLLGY